MKLYIKILSILLIGLTLTQSFTRKTEKANYVVLTRNIAQIKPIMLAAKSLASEDQQNFGEFHIIICGSTVKDLILKENTESLIQAANEGINVVACGFSLDKFQINRKDLPKEIKVVENGLLYNFQLQKDGYLSIEL